MLALEGDRWIATLGGWLGDHAPADEVGFLDYARSLPAPDVYNILRHAEPLSRFHVHKFPSSIRRHYERLPRFPEGYLVFGDALCSFNPIYGQGMSVAALEALTLRDILCGGSGALAPRFFRQAARVIDIPWTLAGSADFAYPQVRGQRPPGTNVVNAYVRRVQQAATRNEYVCRAFFETTNLLRPPASLFRPGVLLRVALAGLRATPGGAQWDYGVPATWRE